jgi:predicted NAD/FAD-binding protein
MLSSMPADPRPTGPSCKIAVVGSGISGLSAAWLLGRSHDVTLFESEPRLGGHSNTVTVPTPDGDIAVDTGFIVFNDATYPNLVALFRHLDLPTKTSEMSFSVSRAGGAFEYAGSDLGGLFAQPGNIVSPRFWSMLRDLVRFYRTGPSRLAQDGRELSLGQFLAREGYGDAFVEDHLLPMAAAIWSGPPGVLRDMPARMFVRFCENHGLLRFYGRPAWSTVDGGSKEYVSRLMRAFSGRVETGARIVTISRDAAGVTLRDARGHSARFDHVVIATHSDQALNVLTDADAHERRILGAIKYAPNRAILHSDHSLMPRRRAAWASWNYVEQSASQNSVAVTYWMNRLQGLPTSQQLFVSLNTPSGISGRVFYETIYDHPVFDAAAVRAQRELWSLQGNRNTWFCGAYFGAGFHEDGLQAGLAVAEDLGGVPRPWQVAFESARIVRGRAPVLAPTWKVAS